MNLPQSKPPHSHLHLSGDGGFNPGCHISLSGRVRVEVLDQGRSIYRSDWQKNLLLDQGMDRLAEIPIANLFLVCGKGTGTSETNVDLDAVNLYDQAGSTLTRTTVSGPPAVPPIRDFTAADIGKRFRTTTGAFEGTILDVPDPVAAPHIAEVSTNQSFTGRNIALWHVGQTGLSLETGVEIQGGAALVTKALGTSRVTVVGGFNALVEGKAIYFPSQDRAFLIATWNSGDASIDITLTGDDFETTSEADVVVYIQNDTGNLFSQSRTSIYSGVSGENGTAWSGEVIGAGAHPDHIKTLTRTFVFYPEPADTVITELIFSDSTTPVDNANIRIKLTSGITVLGPAGVNPGQQLKVTYEMVITFPTVVSATVTCPITDTGGTSGNKNGKYAIEGPQVSGIEPDGDSILTDPVLDPYYTPEVAYSTDAIALAPLAFPIRPSVYTTDTEKEGSYTAGSFAQTFVAVFGVNEAINTNLRTLMLYIPTSGRPAFTFLFNGNQVKDGNHSLTVRFTKTWSRELSP